MNTAALDRIALLTIGFPVFPSRPLSFIFVCVGRFARGLQNGERMSALLSRFFHVLRRRLRFAGGEAARLPPADERAADAARQRQVLRVRDETLARVMFGLG